MNEIEFINKWIDENGKLIPKFPDDFLNGFETEEFKMPGKPVALGTELFGQFEIVDLQGNPIMQSDNYSFVKFLLYSNRNKPAKILKPISPLEIDSVVKKYESKLDSMIKDIKLELNKEIPNSDFLRISNQIFNTLNLQRY